MRDRSIIAGALLQCIKNAQMCLAYVARDRIMSLPCIRTIVFYAISIDA